MHVDSFLYSIHFIKSFCSIASSICFTGSIKQNHQIWTCKLYNFTDVADIYTIICELVYVIILVLQLRKIIYRLMKQKMGFFTSLVSNNLFFWHIEILCLGAPKVATG